MSAIPDEVFKHLIDKNGDALYVVLYKPDGRLDLFPDLALNRPWCSRLKLHAEQVAKEVSGMACTWREAWNLLIKEYPQFEKNLGEHLLKKIEKRHEKLSGLNPSNPNQLLDRHGRPIN